MSGNMILCKAHALRFSKSRWPDQALWMIIPHILCGVKFLLVVVDPRPPLACSVRHGLCPTLSHTHTTLSRTCYKRFCQTHSFFNTQSFTTQLCHTQSFTTQFSRRQSFTHNFLTQNSSRTSFKCLILGHLPSPFFLLRAAWTTLLDFWKKLICRIIRSFHCKRPKLLNALRHWPTHKNQSTTSTEDIMEWF